MDTQPIGILDSGIGGLSVARAILDLLPGEAILYYADTAHFPYGERTPTEVRVLSARGIRRLAERQAKCVVLACNSASAAALDRVEQAASLPVFDMLSPSSLGETLRRFDGARIGLIATSLTVATGAYQGLLEQLARPCELFALPAPRLVRLVEAGGAGSPEALDLVEADLASLRPLGLDALILGCTHFSFLTGPIRTVLGPSVELIDPSRLVARAVADALHAGGSSAAARSPAAAARAAGSRPHRLIVTDGRADRIIAAGERLGLHFERVEVDPRTVLPGYDRDGVPLRDSGGAECHGW